MRRSTIFPAFTVILALAFGLSFLHARYARGVLAPTVDRMRALVEAFDLTDLALLNEASYTRNVSTADLHTAFQEHPLALEHFPTGSIVAPPAALWGTR